MRRRRAIWTAGTALCLLVAFPGDFSGAAFSAKSNNPGSTFSAAASFPGTRVATGTYTGNATNNRAITGVGFTPDAVIIKSATGELAVIRTSTMSGDASKPMAGTTALATNRIKSLTATGFILGTDNTVNKSGTVYYWTALEAHASSMTVGTYTGTGVARSVGGVGFQPDYVALLSAGGHAPIERFDGMSRSYRFESHAGTTTGVTGFGSDGFSVGTDTSANANGTVYHYLALESNPGNVWVGSWTGNGADSRNITGTGLRPQYLVIRADSSGTARTGVHRPEALTGDSSQFYAATANAANRIQSFAADGFQLGSDNNVNASGTTVYGLALADAP